MVEPRTRRNPGGNPGFDKIAHLTGGDDPSVTADPLTADRWAAFVQTNTRRTGDQHDFPKNSGQAA